VSDEAHVAACIVNGEIGDGIPGTGSSPSFLQQFMNQGSVLGCRWIWRIRMMICYPLLRETIAVKRSPRIMNVRTVHLLTSALSASLMFIARHIDRTKSLLCLSGGSFVHVTLPNSERCRRIAASSVHSNPDDTIR
jgi:hypothetical protein